MARHANPQCVRCALLSAEEARSQHGPDGDGCWTEQRCHDRRSYYRHRHNRNRNRRQRRQGEREGPQSLSVPVPLAPTAVLVLYGEQKSRLGVGEAKTKFRTPHALGAEFWMRQDCLAKVEVVHCLGWTSRQLDSYIRQILAEFSKAYGVTLDSFATVVERPSEACPLHPCPLRG